MIFKRLMQMTTLTQATRSHIYPLQVVTIHGASHEKFLKGKVSLVTGSTSGIGLGVAEALAARGSDVVLSGFGDATVIKDIVHSMETKYQIRCQHLNADMTKHEDVLKLSSDVIKAFPAGVDVLVNNAGFQHVSPVQEFPLDKWNDLLAVLLTAPFLLIKSLLPHMVAKRWGRIINVASAHSVKVSKNKAAYCSAKHALAGLTKVVAMETAETGVTCNALSPGFVETHIFKTQVETLAKNEGLTYDDAKVKFIEQFHPTKQPVGVDQLAEMCVFLCSDAASQMVGTNILMDGGWSAK